jgi:hypothetical protein
MLTQSPYALSHLNPAGIFLAFPIVARAPLAFSFRPLNRQKTLLRLGLILSRGFFPMNDRRIGTLDFVVADQHAT